MKVIPQRELRNDNASVIAAVMAGETFTVTRNGVAVAELRPVSAPRRQFVSGAEWVRHFAGAPRIDALAFREDMDRVIDQSL